MSLQGSSRWWIGFGLVGALGAVGCDGEIQGTSLALHESAPLDHFPLGPNFGFASYLGGSGSDRTLDLISTAGLSPRVFAVGTTASTDFPTTDGSAGDPSAPAGCTGCPQDAFVSRFDGPATLAWSTVIAGPGFEQATAVAVALDLDVFVGGSAATLPAAALTGAADSTFAGGATAARGPEDGFVCRLDADTGAPIWCTFVGGAGPGGVLDLVADPVGDGVIAVLTTTAADGLASDPVYAAALAGHHRASPQGDDTLVIRIAGDGRTFTWATYVGGSGAEGRPSVARDTSGVHVVSTTTSTDAPVPGGFATAPAGVYYAHLSSDATALRYGSYLGGAGDQVDANAIVTADNRVFIGVTTRTAGLPVSPFGWQPTYHGAGTAPGCAPDGDGDGWIVGLRPAQTGAASFEAATYLGGSLGDRIGGLAFDRDNRRVLVTGRTHSSDFPTGGLLPSPFPSFSGTPCSSLPGNADGFLASFELTLSNPSFSSYVGGTGVDGLTAVAAGGDGAIIAVAGGTASVDFPTVRGLRSNRLGPTDGVVGVIGPWRAPPVTAVDAGIGLDAIGFDGTPTGPDGGGDDDGDDQGCCGAAPDPASRSAALLLALATLALVVRRRTRASARV